jgi:hypothetical protein
VVKFQLEAQLTDYVSQSCDRSAKEGPFRFKREKEVSTYYTRAQFSGAELTRLKRPPTPFAVHPITAFYVFFGANILAALFAPIQDCDETFNYWEPTHYISHGYGLQTWEYSPEYAIRSWTYLAFHALVGSLRRLLPFPSKVCSMPGSFVWLLTIAGC